MVVYRKFNAEKDVNVENRCLNWIMKSFNVNREAIVEISDGINFDDFWVVFFVFKESKVSDNIFFMYENNKELDPEKRLFCKFF